MSRHLALDPRQPPVQVTMPRQGTSPAERPAGTVAPQGDQLVDAGPPPLSSPPPVSPLPAADAPTSRRTRRESRPPAPREPKPLGEQPLPAIRPAARHHSGVERGGRDRSRRATGSPKATAPRGFGLSKALIALVGSAVVAALAGAWAYQSWSGNRELSREGAAAPKTDVVILDGVADTSNVSFEPGSTQVVRVSVPNPNTVGVTVRSIQPGKVMLAEPVPEGCTPSLVKAVGEHDGLLIPPGGGGFDATVAMSSAAPRDCEGMAFSVTFVVTGAVDTP